MKKLLDALDNYHPYNIQEEIDKTVIITQLKEHADLFVRENRIAHMTASGWVVNEARDKVLMVYHNLYDSWSWMGGHADGDNDLLAVAKKEILEESGLKNVKVLSEDIFSLEVLTVDGHIRRGEYVPSHLHLNVTYLFEANDQDELFIKHDENSGVEWFPLDQAVEASSEPWFKENIYTKLNNKLKKR